MAFNMNNEVGASVGTGGHASGAGFLGGSDVGMNLGTIGHAGKGDSDQFDILGLGLDAKRDIRGVLGLEAQDQIERAQKQYGNYVKQGIAGLESGYGQARGAYNPYMQGTTAEGMGGNIANLINSSMYSNMMNERGNTLQNQLQATGSTRSGYGMNEMADLSTDTLMGLENLLSNRQFAGAQAMSPLYTEESVNIADMLSGLGASGVGATQAAGQARAQGLGGVMDMGGSLIGGMMCDERLKTNIKPIGEMGGLTIYSYDANKEGKRVGMNSRFGPMAQEVQKMHPDLVSETESGYLMVDMDGLLERAA